MRLDRPQRHFKRFRRLGVRIAAAQAKRQGKLPTKGDEQYLQNALKRCERQPEGTARDACVKRVTDAGDTTTRGSVEGGGKIRTNNMQVPATEAPKN